MEAMGVCVERSGVVWVIIGRPWLLTGVVVVDKESGDFGLRELIASPRAFPPNDRIGPGTHRHAPAFREDDA